MNDYRICTCCERRFPNGARHQSQQCSRCVPRLQAGELPADICERQAEATRSVAEGRRLLEVASRHRMNQQAFEIGELDRNERVTKLNALKDGLKSNMKPVREVSGRLKLKKTWRCGRCGTLLMVRRCLACELEIVRE